MSSEIWNIGHYDASNIGTTNVKIGWASVEYFNLDKLSNICSEMFIDFKSVEKDQNEYYIEFDSIEDEYNDLKENIDAKIQELLVRAKELNKKEQNGTITDEERTEMKEVTTRLGELYLESDKQLYEANSKRNTALGNITKQFGEKESLVKEYGDAAVKEGSKASGINTDEGNICEQAAKKFIKAKGTATNFVGNELLSLLGSTSTINKKLV